METKIAVFQGKRIRKTIYSNEWWFSVVDVVGVLTDSANPRDYWYKMKIRDKEESGVELSTNCRQLKLLPTKGWRQIATSLLIKTKTFEKNKNHDSVSNKIKKDRWNEFVRSVQKRGQNIQRNFTQNKKASVCPRRLFQKRKNIL